MSEALIAKWLDDRTSLTEAEASELQACLEADPGLARHVKDQLATDELLSRRLAVDRGQFEMQVAQRIAAVGSERSFTTSLLDAIRRRTRRRTWRAWVPEAAAAALLIAGLMAVLLRRDPASPGGVPASPGPGGLRAEYYKDQFLEGQPTVRIDPKISFVTPKNAGPLPGWSDVYSARWTGKLLARYSERTTFRTENDDGVRVWIDGKPVIDDWKGRMVVSQNRGQILLEAGRTYDLKIEYYNGGDIGVLRLYWSSPSQKEEIIPPSQLRY